MSLTVDRLLAHPALGLRRIVDNPSARDIAIEWVSSSDLADPTPFLARDQVLLTTGSQFLAEEGADARRPGINGTRTGPALSTDYASYVHRLADAGVAALGYGTDVVHPGLPDALVSACEAEGLLLFEVPYRTAFIAVIRTAADALAAAAGERQAWAMNAQRAISFAALRPNPQREIFVELARLLHRPVLLYSAPGPSLARFGPPIDPPAEVGAEAAALLDRGQRAAATLETPAGTVSLQTVGRREDLRAVLAIVGPAPDPAEQSVITNVVALTGLALEQGRGLRRGRRALRSGALEALLDARPSLTRLVLQHIHEALPPEPVRVAIWHPGHGAGNPLLRELDERAQTTPGWCFFATRGREIIVILPADDAAERLAELGTARGLSGGLSEPLGYPALEQGIDQARRALAADPHSPGLTTFSAVGGRGIAELLCTDVVRDRARELLAPLEAHDASHGTELIPALRSWLEHNGQWDPAARELGIHRHTLRARITLIERLADSPLDSMEARTNFWLALRA
ncbi:PucR family transcriptional regulator [Mycetocola tolaasinivorans]|uniref:PucR family transcriptional regulator n=1 Tax=Mycetocola tolaasinivorans TaxID=76635 RepID=A0A3L7A5W0_9MICO|nr:PucR family transcriptional regulator [Mycetocola tolaasinivorans]RLP75699.1 PucR family transcriptional regulator [Mycetocola tolaasinivorans]